MPQARRVPQQTVFWGRVWVFAAMFGAWPVLVLSTVGTLNVFGAVSSAASESRNRWTVHFVHHKPSDPLLKKIWKQVDFPFDSREAAICRWAPQWSTIHGRGNYWYNSGQTMPVSFDTSIGVAGLLVGVAGLCVTVLMAAQARSWLFHPLREFRRFRLNLLERQLSRSRGFPFRAELLSLSLIVEAVPFTLATVFEAAWITLLLDQLTIKAPAMREIVDYIWMFVSAINGATWLSIWLVVRPLGASKGEIDVKRKKIELLKSQLNQPPESGPSRPS